MRTARERKNGSISRAACIAERTRFSGTNGDHPPKARPRGGTEAQKGLEGDWRDGGCHGPGGTEVATAALQCAPCAQRCSWPRMGAILRPMPITSARTPGALFESGATRPSLAVCLYVCPHSRDRIRLLRLETDEPAVNVCRTVCRPLRSVSGYFGESHRTNAILETCGFSWKNTVFLSGGLAHPAGFEPATLRSEV